MAAANVFVETVGIQLVRVPVKKGLVAAAAIGGLVHVDHTHPVGGVAMWTNNVQGWRRIGHGIPCVSKPLGVHAERFKGLTR